MPNLTRRRLPGLDVLRGLAVALVLLRHAWPSTFGGAGIVGVVVFFTLSGYLITGVLLRQISSGGRVAYWHFYRNRILRLVPALLLLLAVFITVEAATNHMHDRPQLLVTAVVALAYLSDLPLGLEPAPSLSHLWTLAVEEQFYLFWPALLIVGARWRGVPNALLLTGVGVWVISILSVLTLRNHVVKAYTLPTSWAVTLIIGAAAFWFRDRITQMLSGRRGSAAAAVALLGLVAMCAVPEAKNQPLIYVLGGPLVAVCTVVLIVRLSNWSLAPVATQPLRLLGVVSYAAYLWDYVIVSWLRGPVDGPLTSRAAWESIPLTLLAAALSWLLVEGPAMRWKDRLDDGHRLRATERGASVR